MINVCFRISISIFNMKLKIYRLDQRGFKKKCDVWIVDHTFQQTFIYRFCQCACVCNVCHLLFRIYSLDTGFPTQGNCNFTNEGKARKILFPISSSFIINSFVSVTTRRHRRYCFPLFIRDFATILYSYFLIRIDVSILLLTPFLLLLACVFFSFQLSPF